MKKESWPSFSFTELLRPPNGWRTENAILSTYSADLTVIVTTLLALTDCDLDHRRTGSRVELVKAIEALRGRVCVLAQTGRVAIPSAPRPILKLLDRFLRTITTDEKGGSWHPKVALMRYHRVDDPGDRQWRVWLGSRNLTRASNWEAGLIVVSRPDGKGTRISGIENVGAALAERAELDNLSAADVSKELGKLTWECPPGVEVRSVTLLGPDLAPGFPKPPSDVQRAFVVSPFLDESTIRAFASWGNDKTNRTIVSTAFELNCLLQKDDRVFNGCDDLLVQPIPDLPLEGADLLNEGTNTSVASAEGEELPPAGLHAKLFFAAKGKRCHLWLGSANATERGWKGRNFEVVAEMSLTQDAADGIEQFVSSCERFSPNKKSADIDEDEEALEKARKKLCAEWSLRQQVGENEVKVVASAPPPLTDPSMKLEVAVLGGTWNEWPRNAKFRLLSGQQKWQRSYFLQVRLLRGERVCAWVQIAPCDPPWDEQRDRAVIAQYLDPRTFLAWLRSLLAEEPARVAGGEWDSELPEQTSGGSSVGSAPGDGLVPTIEEILRAWARNPSSIVSAGEKVASYLDEIKRRASTSGATDDVKMLELFSHTWTTISSGLQ